MENPTGESNDGVLRLDFDRRVKLEFHGSRITSDAGLLAHRELDDALGLSTMAGDMLTDARSGKNVRHALVGRDGDIVRVGLKEIDRQESIVVWRPLVGWDAEPFVISIESLGHGSSYVPATVA